MKTPPTEFVAPMSRRTNEPGPPPVMEMDPIEMSNAENMQNVRNHYNQFKYRAQIDQDLTQMRREMNDRHIDLQDQLNSLKVEAKKTRDQTHYADRELKRTVDRIRQKSVV